MIGDLAEEEILYWENYLVHVTIVDDVFAPVTNVDRTEYTTMMIKEFLMILKSSTQTEEMYSLLNIFLIL